MHPGHPDWQGRCFGASLAAVLCGQSEWATPADVYMWALDGRDDVVNDAMRRGNIYEPAILADYERVKETQVTTPVPALWHPSNQLLYASCDGLREDGAPVEAKFSMSPYVAGQLGEEGSDWVPTEWLFQTQQQMDVVGAQEADIAVLLYGRLKVYTVARNDGIIAAIHSAATEMRDRIRDRIPPPVNYSHPRALECVRRLHADVEQEVIELPLVERDNAVAYLDVKEELKRLGKEADERQARLLDAIGVANVARVPGLDVEFTRSCIAEAEVKAYTRRSYVRFGTRKVKK